MLQAVSNSHFENFERKINKNACLEYSYWNDKKKAAFQRDRGLAIASKGDYKQGAIELQAAKKRDSTIDLNPDPQELETNPDRVAKQLAAPAKVKVKEGEKLAKEGKVKEAIAADQEVQQIDPEIDLNPDTEAIDKEPKAVDRKLAALAKVKEGEKLAKEGKVKEAIATYKEAQQLDSEIDLNPETQAIDKDPKAIAGKLAAPVKVKEGEKLAEQGKVTEAIAAYKEAQQLDPEIDLNPETEAIDKDPKAVAEKLAAD